MSEEVRGISTVGLREEHAKVTSTGCAKRYAMNERKGSILITGCSSGIGRDTAAVLQEAGWDVIASARKQEDVDRLRTEGYKAVVIDNDDDESIAAGMRSAIEMSEGGRVWGVFCNAGYGQPGALEDVTVRGMERQLRTNVIGTHSLLRLAVKHMGSAGGGRILINSSVLGVVGMQLRGCYVVSKFGLEGLADVLRMEVKDLHIDVCLIEPGPVYTRFRANGLKMFREHVEADGSRHAKRYESLVKKLSTKGPVAPFTMTSRRCAEMAAKALTCARPRARYRATVQTKVFSVLKRVLPTRWLDAIAAKG